MTKPQLRENFSNIVCILRTGEGNVEGVGSRARSFDRVVPTHLERAAIMGIAFAPHKRRKSPIRRDAAPTPFAEQVVDESIAYALASSSQPSMAAPAGCFSTVC
ncbi:MAG: hypothetical protein KA144_09360 [Xanthomonadaceae bacterium]|nr:hypothetical protein [Xanthomonadaceae bacterium]